MVGGAALFWKCPWASWVFAVSVVCYLAARMERGDGKESVAVRRLRVLVMLVMVLYIATAVLMFRGSQLWPVVLLSGALADIYLMVRKGFVEKNN